MGCTARCVLDMFSIALDLFRSKSTDDGTPGALCLDGRRVCYMMELPDRNNAPRLSRVNAGLYVVEYLPVSASGRWRDVYWLRDVAERFGIFQHAGNFAGDTKKKKRSDTLGCQLPAMRLGYLAGQLAGLASRRALELLHEITGRQSYCLRIHDWKPA